MEFLSYHINKRLKYILNKIEYFGLKIYYRNISKHSISEIIKKNRNILSTVDEFLPKEVFSETDYGLQTRIHLNLDKQICNLPTYSDLMIYIIDKHIEELKYLEIGASVLKNFMQICNYFPNTKNYVYDINPINPKFDDLFKKENITYFKGNVLSDIETEFFKQNLNEKFNFIFSDALHTPYGVVTEFNNITKELLDDKFIIYFDDYDFKGLGETINSIAADMSTRYEEINLYTFNIYGWIGQYEKTHKNAIISNINLRDTLKIDLNLYKFKQVDYDI